MLEDFDQRKVFETIDILYPGLLDVTWDGDVAVSIYFKDRSITNLPLQVFEYRESILKITFDVIGYDWVWLKLFLCIQDGSLYMFEDLGIPDKCSINLYNQNIRISYGSSISRVCYDMDVIIRRNTISNIISDGE